MNESAEIQPKTSLLRSSRFWFPLSVVTTLVCISLFAAWAATDASFRLAMWKATIAIRIQSIPSANPEMVESLGILDAMRAIQWNSVGKRAIAAYVLFGVGMIATVMVCFLTARRLTLKRSLACMIVLSAWMLLSETQDAINYWCTQRQVTAIFPQFEQVGVSLHNQWPTESGELSSGRKFYVLPEKYPDVLTLRDPFESYPFHEGFGRWITRGQTDVIRFDLAGVYDFTVEFHPNGTVPSHTHPGLVLLPPVASVTPLKENWFLVRYGES